jgi:hypothetical protein
MGIVDAVASRYDAGATAQPVTWLSGGIVTLINKLGPVLWLAAVVGALSGVFLKTGHFFIAPGFRPVIAFVFLATAYMFWLSARIQRVGYAGRDLIVSNYLRQERIPFDQVEAAEPVWWYYRRMVRIRLRTHSSFGYVVYYIPKWAAFKCLWVAPEKELRELLDETGNSSSTDPYV